MAKKNNPGCQCCGSTTPINSRCCVCILKDAGTVYATMPIGLTNSNMTVTLDAAFAGSTTFTLSPSNSTCIWRSTCFENTAAPANGYYRWEFVPGPDAYYLSCTFFGTDNTCASIAGGPYSLGAFASSAPTVGPFSYPASVGAGTGPGLSGATSLTLTQSLPKGKCFWQPLVVGCFNAPISGALVELIQSSSTFASGTTDSTGYPSPIEYTDHEGETGVTWQVSASGYSNTTGSIGCLEFNSSPPPTITMTASGCCQKFQVLGCKSLGISGATVSVYTASGGTLLASGTTDSNGEVILAWTGTCTKWVEVTESSGRFATDASTKTMTTESTTTITMSAASGYHCASGLCNYPLADTLYATDPNGTWTLTYDGSNANGAGWYGCATHTSMASVVTNLNAGVCTKITGTGNVAYVIKVPTSGTTLTDYYGQYAAPGAQQTSATPSCASGALNLNATIPVGCIGSITQASATGTATAAACPTSALSITATMGSTGSNSTSNPGSGSITITE